MPALTSREGVASCSLLAADHLEPCAATLPSRKPADHIRSVNHFIILCLIALHTFHDRRLPYTFLRFCSHTFGVDQAAAIDTMRLTILLFVVGFLKAHAGEAFRRFWKPCCSAAAAEYSVQYMPRVCQAHNKDNLILVSKWLTAHLHLTSWVGRLPTRGGSPAPHKHWPSVHGVHLP